MINEFPRISETARFSLKDTARILKISRPTLYDRIRRGFIRTHKFRDNNRSYCLGSDIKTYYRKSAGIN